MVAELVVLDLTGSPLPAMDAPLVVGGMVDTIVEDHEMLAKPEGFGGEDNLSWRERRACFENYMRG
eukprot:15431931-Alexandrium_andersonii.AAC.1